MKKIRYSLIFIITFLLDRITKGLALKYFAERYEVNKLLSFELMFNRGISWGMLHFADDRFFIVVSVVIGIIACALAFYAYVRWMNHSSIVGEVLVLSGALSNLIDRILHQGVIDFIALSFNGWSWPVFNFADAFIVVGVGIMFIKNYRDS